MKGGKIVTVLTVAILMIVCFVLGVLFERRNANKVEKLIGNLEKVVEEKKDVLKEDVEVAKGLLEELEGKLL